VINKNPILLSKRQKCLLPCSIHEMLARPARGRVASDARGGRRVQTDAEEARSDANAEVADMTAALDIEAMDAPVQATVAAPQLSIPVAILRLRSDRAKIAEAAAMKDKQLMQQRLSDVEAQ
jgi:hypothetical protein